ncbi:hypothetical protein F6X40_10790 [Paraburkholderia sp. UCT31]|uniref:hypothetical protein n=1 Tax=Paraburkholderia sp. UCT31 TaxID=2615209 RepID=UPI001655B18F|nr:hypothetical protein [Paraburkholderia sp. UCT31]MBC8737295.1 hypothetical protein [Paraburkholderia sp. UCT31]
MKTQPWQSPESGQDSADVGQIALTDNLILAVIKPDSVLERAYTSTEAFLLAANLLNQREPFELYDEGRTLLVKSREGELSGHAGYCDQLSRTHHCLQAVLISWLRQYEVHLLSKAQRLLDESQAETAAEELPASTAATATGEEPDSGAAVHPAVSVEGAAEQSEQQP